MQDGGVVCVPARHVSKPQHSLQLIIRHLVLVSKPEPISSAPWHGRSSAYSNDLNEPTGRLLHPSERCQNTKINERKGEVFRGKSYAEGVCIN